MGADLMTGHQGIFAGGDMVPAERTVTVAIGHGKQAARNIDAWLRGASREQAPRAALAGYGGLNTWYYADAPGTVRPKLAATRRTGTFDEVTGGPGDYEIDYDYCKGCGICAAKCPCGAIAMVPEEP